MYSALGTGTLHSSRNRVFNDVERYAEDRRDETKEDTLTAIECFELEVPCLAPIQTIQTLQSRLQRGHAGRPKPGIGDPETSTSTPPFFGTGTRHSTLSGQSGCHCFSTTYRDAYPP